MKKIISMLVTIISIWSILVFIEYIRVYQNNEKMLISIKDEVTEKYTKNTGLGYTVTKYVYNKNDLHDGQILKEFSVLGIVLSKEVVIFKK